MVSLGTKAQLTDGTVYWIQDVGSGQFISQGDDWSTKAVAQDVGGLGFQAVYVSDGVYTLKNIMWNTVKSANVGLGVDVYVDQTPAEWTLTAAEGGYLISTGGNYLANNSAENAYKEKPINKTTDAAVATVWRFLTRSEYDAAIQAYKDSKAATYAANLGYSVSSVSALEAILATDFIGKDYTSSITNPTLGSNWDGWTHGAISGRGEGAGVGSGCAEFWNGCGYATQTVTSLPNGLYKVEFVGTYRPSSNTVAEKLASDDTSSPAFVYANDARTEFIHWIDVPAKANGRSGITKANGYAQSFYTYVSDGTLALGVVADGWIGDNGYIWNPFGQFAITYYSDQVEDDDITALVASIPAVGTIPAAVTTNLNTLQSTLESTKTIAAYNNLTNAVEEAKTLVAPYATYLVAAEDAAIAGVDAAIINAQNEAVASATEETFIEMCISALHKSIAELACYDITDFTIKNPTAQTKDNWEGTDFGTASDNVVEYWGQSGADFHQTLANLPAGSYRLTVIAVQRTNMKGTIYAGEKRTLIAEDGVVNSRSDCAQWFNAGNGVNTVYFTLADAADVTIGLTADATTGDHWTVWKGFKLETFTETVAASYMAPGYDDALAAAQAYLTVDMFDTDKNALTDAINANIVEPSTATIAAYETAIANLNAATKAAQAAAANYTQYNQIVAAIGENTNVDLTSFVANADFQLNNLNGWTSVDGGNVANNGNFNNTYFVERWKNGVALGSGSLTHDAIVLPAGVYQITADAQNIEQYNGGAAGTGLFLCANAEQAEIGAKGKYEVYIKLADKEALTIKFLQDNCTGNWIAYDNVTLTYVAEDYLYTLADGKMSTAAATAQTDAEAAFLANENIHTYNALLAAIAEAQASITAYAKVPAVLTAATAILESTNVYTAEAFETFSTAISTAQTAYKENTLSTADANDLERTLNTAVWGTTPAPASTPFITSAWTSTNDVLVGNFWSVEGDAEGSSGMKTPFLQYWVADNEKLADNTISATLTGLETGLYSVTAFVRVMNNKTGDDAGYDGITLQVNDGTAVPFADATEYPDGFAKELTAEGLVKTGDLNITFAISGTNASWLSFKNVKYTKVRDLTPEEAFVPATAEDYEALAEAIAAKKIGFDEGEYAPYNNIEAISILKIAQLIDPKDEYSQEIVQTATQAILDATWTVNETEVNAIFDGSFQHDYSGQTGNVNPIGWQRVKGAAADGYNVRYMGGANAGLAATSSGKALFTKQSAYYGYTTDYNMPLKAETYYKVSFIYGGWGDCKRDGYVSMAAPDGSDVALSTTDLPVDATDADSNPESWKRYEAIFKTGEAGDYVLGLRKKNFDTNGQSQYVYGDIQIMRATAIDFKAALQAEIEAAQSLNTEVNVGEEPFQIPSFNAEFMKGLIQGAQEALDNDELTTEQIIAFTDNFKAMANSYKDVQLNVPSEKQLFNVILTYDGWDYDNKAITFLANAREDGGLYNIQYKAEANRNLAQAFTFTHVEGNNYKMSQIDADNKVRYLCTGQPYGGNASQIRTTTNAEDAMLVTVIPTAKEGVWNLKNVAANQFIGSQDAGVYTVNSHIDFKLVKTSKPEVTISLGEGEWGTVMLPFAVAGLPGGVTAYTCAETNGDMLVLKEVTELAPNKPYILKGEWNETLIGDAQGTAISNTEGLLTGVYADTEIAATNHYFLDTKDNRAGFYGAEEAVQVSANTVYLTQESAEPVFFFEGIPTSIGGVKVASEKLSIYDLSGRKVEKMVKGVYIVNGKKVSIK